MLKNSRKTAAVAGILLLAVIVTFAWAIFRTNSLGASAQEMALQVVQDTFTEDYPTLLIENSHPDFQAELPTDQLIRYLNGLMRQTGPLQSLESIRGNAEIPLLSFAQNEYLASYELKLNFRDTPADVQIELQSTEGRWLITRLDVLADILAN